MSIRKQLQQYGPYVEPPNAPLFIWAVASLIALATPDSGFGHGAQLVALVALTVWALLELLRGSGPFRRVLGGVVLAAIVIEVLITADVIG